MDTGTNAHGALRGGEGPRSPRWWRSVRDTAAASAMFGGTVLSTAAKHRPVAVAIDVVLLGGLALSYAWRGDWHTAWLYVLLLLVLLFAVGWSVQVSLLMTTLARVDAKASEWETVGGELIESQSRQSAVGMTFVVCSRDVSGITSDGFDRVVGPRTSAAIGRVIGPNND